LLLSAARLAPGFLAYNDIPLKVDAVVLFVRPGFDIPSVGLLSLKRDIFLKTFSALR
jgi:hypothetical protein